MRLELLVHNHQHKEYPERLKFGLPNPVLFSTWALSNISYLKFTFAITLPASFDVVAVGYGAVAN